MFIFLNQKSFQKAQATLQYTVLLILVISGILIGAPYAIKSWNASLKTAEESVIASYRDPMRDGGEEAVCQETGPVDGGYSEWGPCGPCSKECGGGTCMRIRTCTNPAPRCNGKGCEELGPAVQYEYCNTICCPGIGHWNDEWLDYPCVDCVKISTKDPETMCTCDEIEHPDTMCECENKADCRCTPCGPSPIKYDFTCGDVDGVWVELPPSPCVNCHLTRTFDCTSECNGMDCSCDELIALGFPESECPSGTRTRETQRMIEACGQKQKCDPEHKCTGNNSYYLDFICDSSGFCNPTGDEIGCRDTDLQDGCLVYGPQVCQDYVDPPGCTESTPDFAEDMSVNSERDDIDYYGTGFYTRSRCLGGIKVNCGGPNVGLCPPGYDDHIDCKEDNTDLNPEWVGDHQENDGCTEVTFYATLENYVGNCVAFKEPINMSQQCGTPYCADPESTGGVIGYFDEGICISAVEDGFQIGICDRSSSFIACPQQEEEIVNPCATRKQDTCDDSLTEELCVTNWEYHPGAVCGTSICEKDLNPYGRNGYFPSTTCSSATPSTCSVGQGTFVPCENPPMTKANRENCTQYESICNDGKCELEPTAADYGTKCDDSDPGAICSGLGMGEDECMKCFRICDGNNCTFEDTLRVKVEYRVFGSGEDAPDHGLYLNGSKILANVGTRGGTKTCTDQGEWSYCTVNPPPECSSSSCDCVAFYDISYTVACPGSTTVNLIEGVNNIRIISNHGHCDSCQCMCDGANVTFITDSGHVLSTNSSWSSTVMCQPQWTNFMGYPVNMGTSRVYVGTPLCGDCCATDINYNGLRTTRARCSEVK